MTDEQLKPCPFCGEVPTRVYVDGWYVQCQNEKCIIGMVSFELTDWNIRIEGVKMSIELKPCPFCGGSVELNNFGNKYYITCFADGCGAEFKGYEKEKMVNHWNTRAISVHSAAVHESAPKDTDGIIVKDYVIRDIKERAEVGKNKYGGYLKTNNGRSSLWDAYQEALDLVMYLRQLILETVEKS